MLYSTLRFVAKGWVHTQILAPKLHFKYFGFAWVEPLPESLMYGLFALMFLACIGIILGAFYRLSASIFFLSFTYTELIDITYYLNHYYFVSLVAFMMIFVPANRAFSLDVKRKPTIRQSQVPAWTIGIFKLQIAIVYVYAGLAKINYDWLIKAQPLAIWLPANSSLPLIGSFFKYKLTAYLFSWAGMLFDSLIVVFLLQRKTRIFAYLAVIIFHSLTGLLFNIGVFPVVMTFSVLIFFSAKFHEKLLKYLKYPKRELNPTIQPFNHITIQASNHSTIQAYKALITSCLIIFFSFQLLFPWRYLLYEGNIFWTEEGYRFSWRVMLMEKAGTATFYVKDGNTGREGIVPNRQFLNDTQEKQMAMQPDLILQYAHFLKDYYLKQGVEDPKVRAEVYVTLNARPSKLLIDPQRDLTKIKEGWQQKDWILPFEE